MSVSVNQHKASISPHLDKKHRFLILNARHVSGKYAHN